ncbi:hypothetical protein Bca101_077322 [Brassica carinata]
MRPRQTAEGTDGSDMPAAQQLQVDRSYRSKLRTVGDSHGSRQDQSDSSSKLRSLPAKLNATQEDNAEASREIWDETSPIGPSSTGGRMSHIIQKRCKTVISKLNRQGGSADWADADNNMWKRIQNGYAAGGVNNLFELREIDQRVERLEYVGVMELASDVQYMLRGAMQFYGFSHETRISGKQETLFPSSGPTPSLVSTSSPRGAGISQGKRPKPVDEGEPDHDDNAVDARRRHAKHHRHSEVVTSSDSEEEKGGRRRGKYHRHSRGSASSRDSEDGGKSRKRRQHKRGESSSEDDGAMRRRRNMTESQHPKLMGCCQMRKKSKTKTSEGGD